MFILKHLIRAHPYNNTFNLNVGHICKASVRHQ